MFADIALATFSYVKTYSEDILEGMGWLPLFFVACLIAGHAIGVYPGVHLLMGESFPTDIRSLGIGLTQSACMCCATANILIYSFLIENLSFYGTFYFYAAMEGVAIVWGIYTIPDNRGLTLAKVEEKLNNQTQKKEVNPIE